MQSDLIGTTDPRSLAGKLALVTGAGTGIGQGVALELARQGADVVLHYYGDVAGADEAIAQIAAAGRRAIAIPGDLRVVAECRSVVDQAAAFLGGLDALVNNSGVTLTSRFETVDEAQFDDLYQVNIRSHFFCAQQALPYFLERGQSLTQRSPGARWAGGCIVNISSVHGIAGFTGHSVYAGTKGAINAFVRELAIELCPQHVRVNAIAPGSIEVQSTFIRSPSYTREAGNASVPWGRVGLPSDIAAAAAFLISDAAEFVTGHVMYVDGGLTAKMAIPQ